MFKRLESYLRPLREIDWSSWPPWCYRDALLQEPLSFGTRHAMIPPEAVPFLWLGGDGCHYALWIDDPRSLSRSPGVVLVSPMDSYPDAIQWVAPSVKAFVDLIRPDDDWLLRKDPSIARQRREARRQRSAVITAMTADGMGVVEPGARRRLRTPRDPAAIRAALQDLLAKQAVRDALILARNVIAEGPLQPPGFAAEIAAVYTALNRPEYAAVALASYEIREGWL